MRVRLRLSRIVSAVSAGLILAPIAGALPPEPRAPEHDAVSGSENDWLSALCYLGTFSSTGSDLPNATQGSGFCSAKSGSDIISIAKYDSDFAMRNALAQSPKYFYGSGIEPDGTAIVFAVGKNSSALQPLTQFGFSINKVQH